MAGLILLLQKYAPILIGVVIVIGALGYLHHSIYQEGYDDATAKYVTRDTKATAEALGILAESKRINDNQFDKDKLGYETRIKSLNDKLANSNTASVSIRTKGNQACGKGETNDTKGRGGNLGESGESELAEYNRGLLKQAEARIDFMAKELLECSKKVREAYNVK
jgi:hypothetical protein